ncbi:hypothetical protein ONZ45_g8996 [Pleurotus djamor]|nr:hypothetical protein ONZ45_g8996 [Pleurotus djamor]
MPYVAIPSGISLGDLTAAVLERIARLQVHLESRPKTVAVKANYEIWIQNVQPIIDDLDSRWPELQPLVSVGIIDSRRLELLNDTRSALHETRDALRKLNTPLPPLPASTSNSSSILSTLTPNVTLKRRFAELEKDGDGTRSAVGHAKKPKVFESDDDDDSDYTPSSANIKDTITSTESEKKPRPKTNKYAVYGADGSIPGFGKIPVGVGNPHKGDFTCHGPCPHSLIKPASGGYPCQREGDCLWRDQAACKRCQLKKLACIGPGCSTCGNCSMAKSQCTHSSHTRSANTKRSTNKGTKTVGTANTASSSRSTRNDRSAKPVDDDEYVPTSVKGTSATKPPHKPPVTTRLNPPRPSPAPSTAAETSVAPPQHSSSLKNLVTPASTSKRTRNSSLSALALRTSPAVVSALTKPDTIGPSDPVSNPVNTSLNIVSNAIIDSIPSVCPSFPMSRHHLILGKASLHPLSITSAPPGGYPVGELKAPQPSEPNSDVWACYSQSLLEAIHAHDNAIQNSVAEINALKLELNRSLAMVRLRSAQKRT